MASEGSVKNWIISFGPFRVTRPRRIIERDGETVHIGGRAFDVLAYLLEHAGQVVSRRALLEAVWPGTYVEEGNLRFQVAMLRKALGNSHTRYIINVPGRGYCFTAPISKFDEAEPPPAPRRMLILMDGCEHVIGTSATLLEPLKRGSNN